jgi:hypothetical protein
MSLVTVIINQCGCHKRRLRIVGVSDIPRTRKEVAMDLGNKFYDKFAGEHLVIAPDGPVDKAPVWVGSASFQGTDVPITVTPAADGLSCDVMVPEQQIDAMSVTVTADVDDPNTPGTEQLSETFTMTWSHSKATNLNPSATDIPR